MEPTLLFFQRTALPSQNFLRSGLSIRDLKNEFRQGRPFQNVVIDDFFSPETAQRLAREFPAFDGPTWNEYNNPIEIKKACNHWDRFPKTTYSVFSFLNSREFVGEMAALAGDPLFSDSGLHGGGWHSHAAGGKLNTHLDYSIHPKLGLERRLNLIVYLTPGWDPRWNGALGFWEHDEQGNKAALAKEIDCVFNRAVIFDTSEQSWHGLPDPVTSPEGVTRNSIAVYYLCAPRAAASDRGRALFSPHKAQADDPAVLELIQKRSQVGTSAEVYRTGPEGPPKK